MVYAAIMAGGIGSRMGNPELPKQYMQLGDRPVILRTVGQFLNHPGIAHIAVLTPEDWIPYTENLIREYFGATDNISVISGGATRNDTLWNAIRFFETEFPVTEEDILLTHDAVRPFVTARMIDENIALAKQYGACDTVVPATDTIVEAMDGMTISDVPNRAYLYQSQTPQTFNMMKLKTLMERLTPEEEAVLTDGCKIFVMKGEPCYLVTGAVSNIKITYPLDLKLASAILGEAEGEAE